MASGGGGGVGGGWRWWRWCRWLEVPGMRMDVLPVSPLCSDRVADFTRCWTQWMNSVRRLNGSCCFSRLWPSAQVFFPLWNFSSFSRLVLLQSSQLFFFFLPLSLPLALIDDAKHFEKALDVIQLFTHQSPIERLKSKRSSPG